MPVHLVKIMEIYNQINYWRKAVYFTIRFRFHLGRVGIVSSVLIELLLYLLVLILYMVFMKISQTKNLAGTFPLLSFQEAVQHTYNVTLATWRECVNYQSKH